MHEAGIVSNVKCGPFKTGADLQKVKLTNQIDAQIFWNGIDETQGHGPFIVTPEYGDTGA